MTYDWTKISFVVGTAVLLVLGSFTWGAAVGRYEVFPYEIVTGMSRAARRYSPWARPHQLVEARSDASGVTVREPEKMAGGVTLVTSFWKTAASWGPEIRLLDNRGNTLHRWKVRPGDIWPESPHDDRTSGVHNVRGNYVHGSHLLPGGDVVFNIEYLGLIRMDSCGEVVWKLPRRTHHSVFRSRDGNFWTMEREWIDEVARLGTFRALSLPVAADRVLEVTPEGEVLREIDVLEVLDESQLEALLPKFHRLGGDITHGNDVEVLAPRVAQSFSGFEPRDVMISLRNVDSVLVFDPKTRETKFHLQSPLLRQHDPDFLSDGRISIFNNRNCGSKVSCEGLGENYGGSEILVVDPETGDQSVAYRGTPEAPFYTRAAGKHQHLPEGNILITESRAGRVFEVDAAGDIVWEWIHPRWIEELVPEVLEATRYDFSRDRIAGWSCSEAR